MRSKLAFFVGNWRSISVNQRTSEQSEGESQITWSIGGQWLQWTFTSPSDHGTLEVLTLMTYDETKKRHAFYSFNSVGSEPIPHFGNWLDARTLRMETDFGGEHVRIDLTLDGDDSFIQEHWRISSLSEWTVFARTHYSRVSR